MKNHQKEVFLYYPERKNVDMSMKKHELEEEHENLYYYKLIVQLRHPSETRSIAKAVS